MVRYGSRVADIGTDHAYLPTALILSDKIPSAVAADLRKGPLENAEEKVVRETSSIGKLLFEKDRSAG